VHYHEFVPADSKCDFEVLPECVMIPDCEILAGWLPNIFDAYKFCFVDGVTCKEDRIVILDLSSTRTGRNEKKHLRKHPQRIGELDNLQQLYLQDTLLEGNLPLSMQNISTLQIVDISNNFLYGVLPFIPSFKLIGLASNWDLSLPIDLSEITESPTEIPALSKNITTNENNPSLPFIIGISAGALVIVFLAVAVC
jgi:hypothetical protein